MRITPTHFPLQPPEPSDLKSFFELLHHNLRNSLYDLSSTTNSRGDLVITLGILRKPLLKLAKGFAEKSQEGAMVYALLQGLATDIPCGGVSLTCFTFLEKICQAQTPEELDSCYTQFENFHHLFHSLVELDKTFLAGNKIPQSLVNTIVKRSDQLSFFLGPIPSDQFKTHYNYFPIHIEGNDFPFLYMTEKLQAMPHANADDINNLFTLIDKKVSKYFPLGGISSILMNLRNVFYFAPPLTP